VASTQTPLPTLCTVLRSDVAIVEHPADKRLLVVLVALGDGNPAMRRYHFGRVMLHWKENLNRRRPLARVLLAGGETDESHSAHLVPETTQAESSTHFTQGYFAQAAL